MEIYIMVIDVRDPHRDNFLWVFCQGNGTSGPIGPLVIRTMSVLHYFPSYLCISTPAGDVPAEDPDDGPVLGSDAA